MKAIICGAGIAGLSAALALVRQGYSVTVLEQAAAPQALGAGIQISPNGCRVLSALGLLDAVQAKAFSPEAIELRFGRSGRQVFSIPLQDYAQAQWGMPYLHLHRADLLGVLTKALVQQAPEALRYAAKLERYEQNEQGVVAVLNDGQTIKADCLLGCDGIHSAVRKQMMGAEQPRFTGNIAWRMTVPASALPAALTPPTACVWVGKGRHAVTYRIRGGDWVNLVGVVEQAEWAAESWLERGSLAAVQADFAGWHPLLHKIMQAADEHYRWALFDREPLPRWHAGRAVLLGDACHPMLPFLAQGATQALEDAWVLADCLAAASVEQAGSVQGAQQWHLEQAFQRYAALRQPRTAAVQRAARANSGRFHHSAIYYLPLYLLSRVYPQLMHQRMNWLYGYDATQALTHSG